MTGDSTDTIGDYEEASVTNLDNNWAAYAANRDTDTSAVKEPHPRCVRKKLTLLLLGKRKECASRKGTLDNGVSEE